MLEAYQPIISPRDFAVLVAILTAIVGALVVLAIDGALEIHRRHRALRNRESRFTPDEGANR